MSSLQAVILKLMMLIKLVKNHVSCFFFGDPDHKKTNQSVFPRIGSDDKMIVRNRNKRTCVNNKCGEDSCVRCCLTTPTSGHPKFPRDSDHQRPSMWEEWGELKIYSPLSSRTCSLNVCGKNKPIDVWWKRRSVFLSWSSRQHKRMAPSVKCLP